jgi:hypothetical protein
MLKFYLVIGLLLSPLHIGICSAAHPLVTDDAGTMGWGNTAIEVNGEYERQKDHATKERVFSVGSTVSYGVIEAGDIVFSAPYLLTRTTESGETAREQGFGDMVAEFKWRWYEKDGLSLALKPGLVLPIGNDNRGLGAGKVGYQLFMIATKELKPFLFHANAGYIRNENTVGEREDLWHASLAGELPVAENLSLVANGGIDRDPDPSYRKEQYFCLGGLIWTLSKSFAFDGGLKYSATMGGAHGWSFLTGATFQF